MKYDEISGEGLFIPYLLNDALGHSAAIMFNRIAFWVDHNATQEAQDDEAERTHYRDGRYWVYYTYEGWSEHLHGILQPKTVKRTIYDLEELGLIESSEAYNKKAYDRTKWYTYNQARIDAFLTLWEANGSPRSGDGPKSAEHKAFLEQWEVILESWDQLTGQVDP